MPTDIQKRRDRVLEEIAGIRRLRQGQLSEQYYDKVLANGEVRRLGPYYVLQRQCQKKKRSVRIRPEQVDQLRRDLSNYQRFKELTQQLAELTEECALAEDDPEGKKKPRPSAKRMAQKSKHS